MMGGIETLAKERQQTRERLKKLEALVDLLHTELLYLKRKNERIAAIKPVSVDKDAHAFIDMLHSELLTMHAEVERLLEYYALVKEIKEDILDMHPRTSHLRLRQRIARNRDIARDPEATIEALEAEIKKRGPAAPFPAKVKVGRREMIIGWFKTEAEAEAAAENARLHL